MTDTFKQAVEQISTLPEADQETIGRGLLSHLEKLRRLRKEIERGVRSLDKGEGEELDIEDFVRQAHARHGRA